MPELADLEPTSSIRVLVVDDHSITRHGVVLLVKNIEGVEVIGEAADGNEAIQRVNELLPDVVLMDVDMPRRDGISATRQIRQDYPSVGVLILTVHEDQETIFEAIKAGASGYLPKSAKIEDIRSAVQAVGAGGSWLDPVQARKLLRQFNQFAQDTRAAADVYYLLTSREREILALLAEGLTSRQIAKELMRSERTVNAHIRNIYRKLGVDNRVDAVREAMRVRLVEPSDDHPREGLALPAGVALLRRLDHRGPIRRLNWSTAGDQLLVVGNRGRITIWETAQWTARQFDSDFQEIPADVEPAPSVSLDLHAGCFAPDGRYLAAYRQDGLVKVWDFLERREVGSLPGNQPVGDVVWLRDGRSLASTAADHAVRIWNPFTDEAQDLVGHVTGVVSLAVSPDGRWLASGSDGPEPEIIIWDVITNRLRHRLRGHDRYVADLSWAPDGRILVSGSGDQTVCVWDPRQGRLLHVLEGHTDDVRGVGFSPDGELLATKSLDGVIRLWARPTWELLGVIHEEKPGGHWRPISFHPKDLLLAVASASDQAVFLCEISPNQLDGRELGRSIRHVTAKVVLVGDAGVGKTGLGWRMVYGSFKEHPSTHGQQFWALEAASMRRNDGADCEAVLWDLAGQPDYRLVHSLFLDDADLALVLFNPTSREDPLQGVEFWLKALSRHGEQPCPVILVGARLDRGHLTLTSSEIDRFCREHEITGGYVGTSALDGTGVDELLERIKTQIPWDDMPTTATTAIFKRIKDYILSLKQQRDDAPIVTDPEELHKRLKRRFFGWSVPDDELVGVVRHLAKSGYVQLLPHPSGEQVILLVPDLLNNLACSFVLKARGNPEGLGSLRETDVLRGVYDFPELHGLSAEEARILLDAATMLFVRHNLCFRETHGNTTHLIFPALINQKKPLDDTLETIDYVTYVVTGAVENVYPALAVLLGYTNVFSRTNQWQNQARYEIDGRQICGFRQVAEAEGAIKLVLYHASGTAAHARQLFQALVEQFLAGRKIIVERYRTLRCSKCKNVQEPTVVIDRIKRDKSVIYCSECGKQNKLPGQHDVLLHRPPASATVRAEREVASVRTRFETGLVQVKALGLQDHEHGPSCFISYAWGDDQQERWVRTRLAKDLKNAGVQVVLDQWRSATIGTNVARFISELDACDAIVVVGTPLYLRKYENEVSVTGSVVAAEMDLVSQRLTGTEAEKRSVFPILLAGTADASFPPLVQGKTYADLRNPDDYLPNLFDLILSLYNIPFDNPMIIELRESVRAL